MKYFTDTFLCPKVDSLKVKTPLMILFLFFAMIVGTNKAYSQCSIAFNPNLSPDTIKLTLNTAGVTNLNHNALFGIFVGSSSADCDTVLIFNPATNAIISNNDTMFTCSDIGVHSFQLAVADGNEYFNTPDLDTLSNKVNVFVKVVDENPPSLVVSPSDTVLNCLWLPVDSSFSQFTLTENCSGQVIDTSYTDLLLNTAQGDTVQTIQRVWTVTTMNDGIATDTQYIHIRDTIDAFWDTTMIQSIVAADSTQLFTDSCLVVLIDTSSSNGLQQYNFYLNTFLPTAIDSCLGALSGTPVVTLVGTDTIASTTGCTDTIRLTYNAVDTVGNATGTGPGRGNFKLSLVMEDTTAPEIIEMPFSGVTSVIPQGMGMMDTFLVYVDSGMCSKTFLADEIDIQVRDSVSLDSVGYQWRVDSLFANGMAGNTYNSGATFTSNDTAVTRPFIIGDYKITYIYQDSTCGGAPNIDSLQFMLKVRTWEPVLTAGFDATSAQIQQVIPGVDTTLVFFNEANQCGINIDSSSIRIIAQDTFENDTIIYHWKIRTLTGTDIAVGGDTTSSPTGLFTSADNAAVAFYPVGLHELTYLFRDTSQNGCFNVDSIKYLISVRDTAMTGISMFPNAAPFGTGTTLTVDATTSECTESISFDEPTYANFMSCQGAATATSGVTIDRIFVSGPDPDVFDGKPVVDLDGIDNLTATFPVGTTVFRYVFTDPIGSSDSIDLTVIVTDLENPTAGCPGPQTIIPDAACMATLPDYTTLSDDNCELDTVMQFPAVGATIMNDTIITIVAVDLSGNTDTCRFPVTITAVAPVPQVALVDTIAECTDVVLFAPIADVDCNTIVYGIPLSGGGVDLMTSPPSYSFSGTVNTNATVTWLFNGSGGTFSTQSQTISFANDTTNPMPMANDTTVYLDSLGMITFTATNLGITATDNCTVDSNIIITTDILSAACDTVNGFMVLKIYAEDEAGNIDSTQITVKIEDNRAPDFIGIPADTMLTCGSAMPPLPSIQIRDNCTSLVDSVLIDTVSTRLATLTPRDSAYYNYELKYIWTATDDQNNTAKDSVVYTFRDTEAPVIPYTNPLQVGSSPAAVNCSANVSLNLLADITENCSDTVFIAVDFSPTNGTEDFIDTTMVNLTIPMGSTSIIIRARDVVGNESKDTLVIEVDDQTAPRPVCAQSVSVTINPLGFVKIQPSDINLNSSDNCTANSDLTFSLVGRDSFTCADVGQTFSIDLIVTDEAGLTAGCNSNVSIDDFTGSSTFSCPANVTIDCSQYSQSTVFGFPTVVDVCGDSSALSYIDVIAAGGGGACRIVQRTWTATDAFGNATSCTQMINLLDTIAPSFKVIYTDTLVNCIASAITADSVIVEDDCATDYMVGAIETTTISGDTIIITKNWSATDGCQSIAMTQVIKVLDTAAPTIAIQAAAPATAVGDTLFYNTSDFIPDSCGVLVSLNIASAITDCNSNLGLGIQLNGVDTNAVVWSNYFPVGRTTLIIGASDAVGNVTTKTIYIDVQDTSIPTVVCVGNRTISLGTGGTGVLQISDVFSSATDNCDGVLTIASASLSQSTFDCSHLGAQSVTLSVVDAAGNIGTCTVNVNVINGTGTSIINIAASATDETFTGANDGSASVTVSGGSGNYTYAWSPGGATTSTITNLAPGSYTVVVNDATSGCRLTETVTVGNGGTVIYTLGQGVGTTGDIVQIPVTVTNFDSVAGFEMKFTLANTAVAEFINGNEAGGFNFPGLTNSAFQFQNAGELDVTALPSQGTTLADGTRIFFINVLLKGAPGQTVALNMLPLAVGATAIETAVIQNGSAIAVNSTGGTITLTVSSQNASFGGNIHLENNVPIENVEVVLSGGATAVDSTDAAGDYSFNVAASQNLTVTPNENRAHNKGLNVTDLAIIQNHILGNMLLNSPYKMIAADVNGNERITVTDLAEIQSVILGIRSEFFTAPSWKFIPADFPITLADPWANPIPNSISNVSANTDFIAVKMGDVTLSATTVTLQTETNATSRDIFRFGVEDRLLKAGEVIEVPFKADNFTDMFAYQMTINANAEYLTFESATAGALTDIDINNFGLNNAARGLISTLWYAPEPLNIEQNATLFTISFRVNKGGKYLSDILRASSDMLSAEAFAEGTDAKNISLTFDENKATEGFELFQNKPNPFSAETTISFSLPKANSATVRFFDFSGRLVHQIKGAYDAGMNNIVVHKNDLSGSGVLYYELATPTFTARKKMIVLD